MMNPIKILLIMITLSACDQATNTATGTDSKKGSSRATRFDSYIQSLEKIEPNFKHSSRAFLPKISGSYNVDGFKSFKHNSTFKPFGICFQDETITGIIDYSNADLGHAIFLTTFDATGIKIDSANLFTKSGESPNHKSTETAIFDGSNTISVLDTVYVWQLNEAGSERLEETMEVKTGRTNFQILANGEIRQSNN